MTVIQYYPISAMIEDALIIVVAAIALRGIWKCIND